MILNEKLISQNVIVNPESSDRWDIIAKLIRLAESNDYVPENTSEGLIKALIDREKTMSTGIGNNIAIPHCRVSFVDEVKVLLCISKNGLEFESLDGQPVNLVVMLIVPEDKQTQHVRTLASIARVLMDDSFKQGLIEQPSPESVMDYIKENIND